MNKNLRLALIGILLLTGLTLLLVGQSLETRAWSLALGILLLAGGAWLAHRQRRGRQAPLVGEYRWVPASEEGFMPMREPAGEQQKQAQRRAAEKPQQAAESVRLLLAKSGRRGGKKP
ncbi:MAG: hypothetical protein FJY95_21330 [Candidatus Handelsmanbacteria bacterium]|nr:hypothetical protein [Candidatus Handelsmanbacteria bacterium]